MLCTLTSSQYDRAEKWVDFFARGKNIRNIPYDSTWHVMFCLLFESNQINDWLADIALRRTIYPAPEYLFGAFMLTSATDLKVVILGQDPYFHHGQAMGMSFSVPCDVPIPSSLDNIFANMLKYQHIDAKPSHGNLWFIAAQGCLMLNSALTVEDATKASHMKIWERFTDQIIEYISRYMRGVVFVLWGAHAYKKLGLIDLTTHHTVISSHPSGLSANKPMRGYPAFMDCDHFGEINRILVRTNRSPILWR
jgi:uracil-DNA glycosylase